MSATMYDVHVLDEFAEDWQGIQKLLKAITGKCRLVGSVIHNEPDAPEEAFSLPLVLAYATLDKALSELAESANYAGFKVNPKTHLGVKMETSVRVGVLWIDYDTVEAGKQARNDVAHKAKFASKADCLQFIQAVEQELKSWGFQ